MPSPTVSFRPTPVAAGTGTPASAYARERRILTMYTALLYAATTDTAELITQVLGPKKPGKQMNAAEDRLDYEVPELLERLRWDEQAEAEALLVAGDLAGCIRFALKLEWSLLKRERPNTAPDDTAHARAAGLGKISSQNYGKLHPGYLFRLPEPTLVVRPMLRPKARRRAARPWLKMQQLSLGL